MFSGHDHVYERAEHNGIRYFVSGGGGAPLYPRRPHPNPVDLEAVKKFERSFHFLRVTVTGSRVEVTGVRSDGTVIETTAWTVGSAASPPEVAARPAATVLAAAGAAEPLRVPAAGAAERFPAQAPAGVDAALTDPAAGSLVWIGLGGVGLLLAAAVVVVLTLRR